jgi:hypothetical protein
VPDPEYTDSAETHSADAEAKPADRPPAAGRFATPIFVGLLAGGILLAVFVVAVLRSGDRSLLPRLTGTAQAPALGKGEKGAPSIISPLGTVPHGSLALRWIKAAGIDDYEAYIYDNRIQIIWRSGKVRTDTIEVPAPVRDQIVPGPTYFWRVVGYHDGDQEDSSPTVQFVLAP